MNTNRTFLSNVTVDTLFRFPNHPTVYRATFVRVGDTHTTVNYTIEGSDSSRENTFTKVNLTTVLIID